MLTRYGAFLALVIGLQLAGSGCMPARRPVPVDGLMLQPGLYQEASFRSPDFVPEQLTYHLEEFRLEGTRGVEAAKFLPLFQSELARAWQANGLKLGGPDSPARVSGAIRQVSIKGAHLRFLLGRIRAELEVSGTISRDQEIVFAFRDRISMASPVNPGRPAPKEAELLLQQLSRTFAHHLLNEMLLNRPPAPSGGDLPKNPD